MGLSKENALSIILNLLDKGINWQLTISDTLPDYATIYNSDSFPKDSWYISVHNPTVNRLGPGRIIGMNKKTGEIFYDGDDGGE